MKQNLLLPHKYVWPTSERRVQVAVQAWQLFDGESLFRCSFDFFHFVAVPLEKILFLPPLRGWHAKLEHFGPGYDTDVIFKSTTVDRN